MAKEKPGKVAPPQVTEHDDGRTTVVTDFGKFEIDVDGSVKATTDTGVFEIDEDGNARLNIENIKKISIDDITSLKSHTIEESDSAISHHIVFRDDGFFRITYRKTGKLIECRGQSIKQTITKDGHITLRSSDSSDE